MSNDPRGTDEAEDPRVRIELTLTQEYLRERGYDPHKLHELPEDEREGLLRAAAMYVTARLENIESTARFAHMFHEAGGTGPQALGL
jgi:hypothetical protein